MILKLPKKFNERKQEPSEKHDGTNNGLQASDS